MAIQFDFQSFTITQDEGDPFWRCNVTLVNPKDAYQFKPNDEFELNIMGELFNFLVNSVSISKTGPVDISATLEGVGIGAALDIPRASAITKVWDTDITAHDVVVELLDTHLDTWNFIDWTIPGNRLSVENGSKIELAKTVVEAAGGVLESFPNGEFVVRKKFPTSPLKYDIAVPDLVIDEVLDVVSISFNYQNSRYVDWVRIRDVDESGVSDRIEMEFDEGTEMSGTLKVYPHPWRPVHLEHTGPASLVLTLIGEVSRLVPSIDDDVTEELVEIFEGQGNTKYPIVDIVTTKWQARDLLSLYHDPDSETVYSSHPTEKNTLVYLTYHTRSINYRVESPVPQDIQFLVVED